MFRRIEKEDKTFEWMDYSTGGVHADKNKCFILETWYQKHLISNTI